MKVIFALLLFILFSTIDSIGQWDVSENSEPIYLGESKQIWSPALEEYRTLNVYLPNGYNANDSIHYPVIYLLDGSADEDFVHVCGLVQFFDLMQMRPQCIVIGIANVDRRRDFTYPTSIEKDKQDFPTTGGSGKFIEFIKKDLQPFVESTYKTNTSKTIIGQSLGGLVAAEILFRYPQLFTTYIIVSPSFWWDNESLLKQAWDQKDPAAPYNASVYVAVGKEGKRMIRDAKKLVSKSKKSHLKKVVFQYLNDEDHATILHEALYLALKQGF